MRCLHEGKFFARKTPRFVSQREDLYFANISAKAKLFAKPFEPVNQDPRWVLFVKNSRL